MSLSEDLSALHFSLLTLGEASTGDVQRPILDALSALGHAIDVARADERKALYPWDPADCLFQGGHNWGSVDEQTLCVTCGTRLR